MATSRMSREELDRRITFDPDRQIMEVSFEGLEIEGTPGINAFYDRIEERIAESGESLWFFLVNYSGARINADGWFAHSRRGRALNRAHSMGSVRYDASPETRARIEQDAGTDFFDPNLFDNRDDALARLESLPSLRAEPIELEPSFHRTELDRRIEFMPELGIMHVDFSGLSLEHSRDVDLTYDYLEDMLRSTGRKWYFVVNYADTRIHAPAWVRYAQRGKALNAEWSLGSVRYAPGSETETDIRLRAESQDFRPNIRNTWEEALDRVAELKAEAMQTA